MIDSFGSSIAVLWQHLQKCGVGHSDAE